MTFICFFIILGELCSLEIFFSKLPIDIAFGKPRVLYSFTIRRTTELNSQDFLLMCKFRADIINGGNRVRL